MRGSGRFICWRGKSPPPLLQRQLPFYFLISRQSGQIHTRSSVFPSGISIKPRADAYIRPNEGERKVYLLERADRMNSSAQNAMLKLLEEGPRYAAFLLVADNPGGLLETVRLISRQSGQIHTRSSVFPSGISIKPPFESLNAYYTLFSPNRPVLFLKFVCS